ncbi:MAG: tRNA (adenosine(37)-N6)-threonylcarbamoyltransferase complex transferase subunit TsaD [Vampirovibrionales bacterium]|nr:tRNA (adenosine(37)-N6)-threonylcarbamoyltransferase complex transferase subunit TsaD [Vampirovibrionales bacterium]
MTHDLILAIETSCDDTAAAVVANGRQVLSSVRINQDTLHAATGGVVPEVAARQHLNAMHPVIHQALNKAGVKLNDVNAIAATLGPGLVGSLLIGTTVAKSLAVLANKPFIPVHHLQAHVCSVFLESTITPPLLALLISGGHTQLLAVTANSSGFQVTLLGETLDDAVGETYDKIGRQLGLGFPAGPEVDRRAALGNAKRFALPIAKTEAPLDFSYSGLKTATIRLYQQQVALVTQSTDHDTLLNDLCTAFQQAAIAPLVTKTLLAAKHHGFTNIAICGGVSANQGLRNTFADVTQQHPHLQVVFPPLRYCTDNAAMVGAAAYFTPYQKPLSGSDSLNPLGWEVFSRSPWGNTLAATHTATMPLSAVVSASHPQ